jgi:hypothetical protein
MINCYLEITVQLTGGNTQMKSSLVMQGSIFGRQGYKSPQMQKELVTSP